VIGDAERLSCTVAPARAACAGLAGSGTHDVLADLDVDAQAGEVGGVEEEVGPEGDLPEFGGPAGPHDRGGETVVGAVGEPALLVELAVVRQVRLGDGGEDLPAVDRDRAVVEAVAHPQRSADDDQRQEILRCRGKVGDGQVHGVKQHVLEEEVVERVPGQRQFGEHRDRDALVMAGLRLDGDRARVGGGIGKDHRQGAGRDPREPVAVERGELHAGQSCTEDCAPPASCTSVAPGRGVPP